MNYNLKDFVEVDSSLPMRNVAMFADCILGLFVLAKLDKIASISKAIPLITRVRQTVIRRPSFFIPKYPNV